MTFISWSPIILNERSLNGLLNQTIFSVSPRDGRLFHHFLYFKEQTSSRLTEGNNHSVKVRLNLNQTTTCECEPNILFGIPPNNLNEPCLIWPKYTTVRLYEEHIQATKPWLHRRPALQTTQSQTGNKKATFQRPCRCTHYKRQTQTSICYLTHSSWCRSPLGLAFDGNEVNNIQIIVGSAALAAVTNFARLSLPSLAQRSNREQAS